MKTELIILFLVLSLAHCASATALNYASSSTSSIAPTIAEPSSIAEVDPLDTSSGSYELQQYNQLSSRLDVVVGKWYLKFSVKSRRLPKSALNKLAEQIIADCEREMQSILRGHSGVHISYQSYLSELRADIAELEAQQEDETTEENSPSSKPAAEWRKSRWFRTTKWVAARALMVGVNFAQYELQRRLKIRAAERRLAEVPEFPLL